MTIAEAISSVRGGLAVNGTLMVIGVEAVTIDALALLRGGDQSKDGIPVLRSTLRKPSPSAHSPEYAQMTKIVPLEQAAEGYERMMSGRARFPVVSTTGN